MGERKSSVRSAVTTVRCLRIPLKDKEKIERRQFDYIVYG